MSPEQAPAKRIPIDHRTDVYSLGATLYEALTLKPPFEGATLQELCAQIITTTAACARVDSAAIPKDLETIVLKAMEKDRTSVSERAEEHGARSAAFAEGTDRRAAARARCPGDTGS